MPGRRPRFTPWIGKIPGKGDGYPLQYSCPENINCMDRGAWWATVHGVTKSQTRLTHTHTHTHTQVRVDPVHSHFQLKVLDPRARPGEAVRKVHSQTQGVTDEPSPLFQGPHLQRPVRSSTCTRTERLKDASCLPWVPAGGRLQSRRRGLSGPCWLESWSKEAPPSLTFIFTPGCWQKA